MDGNIYDSSIVVDEVAIENMENTIEEEIIEVQPADCHGDEGQEDGLAAEQADIDTDADTDEENLEDEIDWDLDRDNVDYWMQEFNKMLNDYEPVTKTMSKFKRKLGKPKTLLVAGGGIAAFGLALMGVVAGKKTISRSVVHTLPVQRAPERKPEPAPEPAPAPPVERTPPPGPWPFFYFR